MPIDPFLGSFMVQAGAAGVNAVSRGGPRRQYKWNKRAAEDSNAMNRANAEWALEQNKRLQEEQRIYDSPEAQMLRYKKAGLNPHLIYGSGSSAGSAFPISTPGIAPTRVDAPMASYGNIGSDFLQAGQVMAQTSYTAQRENESRSKTALIDLQNDIAKTNPMLNPQVAQSVSNAMEFVAEQKFQEAAYMTRKWSERDMTKAEEKVEMQVQKMAQELGLNTADLKIKNKILESKQFENAIKELQTNWLKDGDFTPEHIRQGLMLILSKMLGR